MAPGFFGKIGDFFKTVWGGVKKVAGKVWDGVKKVAKPIAGVVKKVWDVAKPIAAPALAALAGSKGVPPELVQMGLGVGENLLGKIAGEKPPEEEPQPEQYEEEQPYVNDPGPAYYQRRGAR
jgi:hypothetical protein